MSIICNIIDSETESKMLAYEYNAATEIINPGIVESQYRIFETIIAFPDLEKLGEILNLASTEGFSTQSISMLTRINTATGHTTKYYITCNYVNSPLFHEIYGNLVIVQSSQNIYFLDLHDDELRVAFKFTLNQSMGIYGNINIVGPNMIVRYLPRDNMDPDIHYDSNPGWVEEEIRFIAA